MKVASTGYVPHIHHFLQIPLPRPLGPDAMTWQNLEELTLHWLSGGVYS